MSFASGTASALNGPSEPNVWRSGGKVGLAIVGTLQVDEITGPGAPATSISSAGGVTLVADSVNRVLKGLAATAPITLTPSPSTVTIGHANSAVAPGTYNNATMTVDAQGHVTFAASGVNPYFAANSRSNVANNNFVGIGADSADETDVRILVSHSGTLQNFRVLLNNAPGGVQTRTETLLINSVATGITVTLVGASTSGTSAATAAVVAGQFISVRNTQTGGAALSKVAWAVDIAV